MALKHSKTGLLLQNRNVRNNPAMDVLKWPTLEERRRKTVFKPR